MQIGIKIGNIHEKIYVLTGKNLNIYGNGVKSVWMFNKK